MAATTMTGVGVARQEVSEARGLSRWLEPVRVAAVSACVLAPCFWHSRIQAGDLASHVYTAALGNLAGGGKLTGIAVVPQWTNVLFDLVLSRLLRLVDANLAQQLAVSAAVLIFFWGAFSLVSAAAPKGRPWHLAPVVAMLAFGWVFHAGFFNFYIALGLGMGALALVMRGSSPARLAAAILLLALAAAAHAIGAGWAAGACVFVWLSRTLSTRRRWMLAGVGVVALFLARLVLSALFVTTWTSLQATCLTGADQLWVYGSGNYFLPTLGLVLVWTLLGMRYLEQKHLAARASAVVVAPLAAITSASVLLLPNSIQVPLVAGSFSYIAFRTSLAAAVLLTAVVAGVRPTRTETGLIGALAVLFFSALYFDTRQLNQLEDRVTAAVRTLPPGQRVLNGLCWPEGRIDPALHLVDRACLGHCYSYGTYEPSSGQFRVRALRDNPYVLSQRSEVVQVEWGEYQVAARDLPVYQVDWSGPDGEVQVRSLRAGELAGRICLAQPGK